MIAPALITCQAFWIDETGLPKAVFGENRAGRRDATEREPTTPNARLSLRLHRLSLLRSLRLCGKILLQSERCHMEMLAEERATA